jgi:hypothetical protein
MTDTLTCTVRGCEKGPFGSKKGLALHNRIHVRESDAAAKYAKAENTKKAKRQIAKVTQLRKADALLLSVKAKAGHADAVINDKPARKVKVDPEKPATKETQAVALLKGELGVSLNELMTTFGWQAHTVRGFVAIAKRKGLISTVESWKASDGQRMYRADQRVLR